MPMTPVVIAKDAFGDVTGVVVVHSEGSAHYTVVVDAKSDASSVTFVVRTGYVRGFSDDKQWVLGFLVPIYFPNVSGSYYRDKELS